MSNRLRRFLNLRSLERRDVPDATPHVLASSNFSQDWSDIALITINDDWTNVPSIIGYLGDDPASTASGKDPQTILTFGTGTQDVIANQTNPNTLTSGGVAEFDTLANPVVALQGSGTADFPFLLFHLDTTGVTSVVVNYTLRDIDGSADNAIQPVALQYRVGDTGDFINLPAGFVADATQGPNLLGPDIPISVTLPAAADGQSLVQVRVMTANAVGNDEWVGIDDILITATKGGNNAAPTNSLPPTQTVTQNQTLTLSSVTNNAISVSDPDVGAGQLKVNLKATDGKFTLAGTSGLSFLLGDGTDDVEVTFTANLTNLNAALDGMTFTPTTGFLGAASLTIFSDDQGNTGLGGAKTDTDTLTINVIPPLYFPLASGNLTQDWSNTNLITADNKWDNVPSIRGYRGDNLANAFAGADPQTVVADGSTTPLNVIANQSNPDTLTAGGIGEFDGLANPVVALQGSGTADAPHLVIFVDATNTTGVRLKFNAIDIDGSADDAIQKIAVQWRLGNTGDFINIPAGFIADATEGPGLSGKTTAVDVTLPPAAANQPEVQIRIITCDAVGSDEWVGIDDIVVMQGVGNANQPPINKVPGTQYIDLDTPLSFSSITLNGISTDDVDAGAGLLKVNLKVANGTLSLSGTTGLSFSLGDGTADPEMTFTGMLFDINTALEGAVYTPNSGFTGVDTFTITTDDQGNTGGPAQVDTDSFSISINPVIEGTYHNLFGGPLLQDWSNAGLITTNNDWSGVPSIIGFRGDNLSPTPGFNPQSITAYGKPPVVNVLANQTNPDTLTTGGVAEFDTLTNPVVALQPSTTASAPHLTFYLNTLNVTNVVVAYDLIDIDGSADNATQAVAVQYRIGTSGPFIDLPAGFVSDATEGPSLAGLVTPVSFVLPAVAEGKAKVQVRVITGNAAGNDEWVGIDNINISATPIAAAPSKVTSVVINNGAVQRSRVTSLKVNFDNPVSVANPTAAFSLVRVGDSASVTLNTVIDGSGTFATITFTGGAVDGANPVRSLADGRYTLTANASAFGGGGLDGDGNGVGGDNFVLASTPYGGPGNPATGVFRLFGDSNGNGQVGTDDFLAFRLAFLSNNDAFDNDGNASVGASDFLRFRLNFLAQV
jgi:hypothetical protein